MPAERIDLEILNHLLERRRLKTTEDSKVVAVLF